MVLRGDHLYISDKEVRTAIRETGQTPYGLLVPVCWTGQGGLWVGCARRQVYRVQLIRSSHL